MLIEVKVLSTEHASTDLRQLLASEVSASEGVSFEIREVASRQRGLDNAVLVAVVGSAGTALGALVAGVVRVAATSKARSIVLEGRSGRKIQYPSDLPPEKVRELVALVSELDGPTIRI
jgi:hypothetical protein